MQYVAESDEVAVRPRGADDVESFYASVVAQVILRTLHELFAADCRGWLETVNFNGMTTQAATGRPDRRVCLVTLRTSRSEFAGLTLTRQDPATTWHSWEPSCSTRARDKTRSAT